VVAQQGSAHVIGNASARQTKFPLADIGEMSGNNK
jgi:hypothetical protein